MEKLLPRLKADYPHLTFVQGSLLCWSPEKKAIYYDTAAGDGAISGVLHELGHARLRHTTYQSDIDLLKKEAAAWEEARQIATQYGVTLEQAHIQDCLDTYRDWLYKRSTCPKCSHNSVQTALRAYQCLNCTHAWRVTAARFFRPYRLSKNKQKPAK